VDKKVDIKWRQKTDYLQVSSKQLPSVSTATVVAYG
jgi:hypothetical protein